MSTSTFDFNSQAGIAAILLHVRQSDLADDAKSELRDQIFTYVRSGGDAEMRTGLEEILLSLPESSSAPTKKTIKPMPTAEPSEPTVAAAVPPVAPVVNDAAPLPSVGANQPVAMALGQRRVTPLFAAVQTSPAQSVKTAEPMAPVQSTVAPTEVVKPPVTEASAPDNLPTIPEAQPVSVEELTNTITADVPEPVPTTREPANEGAIPVPTPTPTTVDPLTRIKAIKAEVNAAVGNPVHLMAEDNPVGKDYMTTLLAAIKATNAGYTAEISQTMERLEVLRTKVLSAARESQSTPTVVESKAAEPEIRMQTEVPASQTQPDMMEEKEAAEQKKSPAPIHQPIVEGSTVTETVAAAPLHSVTAAAPLPPMPPKPVLEKPTPQTPGSAASRSLKSRLFGDPDEPEPVVPAPITSRTQEAQAVVSEPTSELPSAAEQLVEQQAVLAAKAAAAPKPEAVAVSADPLEAPDITSGLDQLLSEWKLFKSSGIFGTGPSGREHELYGQLAKLPMSVVISGRFEGATPVVRQSISDYMNGWRYEQGIIHDTAETFEHYLRRVIKHILDKAKS